MFRGRHRLVALLTVAAGTWLVPAPRADAATITACVKNRTGEVRILSSAQVKQGKKCRKGWRRVRWSTTGPAGIPGSHGVPGIAGPTGPTGPAGPAGPVVPLRDSTGAVVGQLVGVFPGGLVLTYSVLRDGGLFTYYNSGHLLPSQSPSWTTADCSGTAYLRSTGVGGTTLARMVAGPYRVVFRTSDAGGTFGPAIAWRATGAVTTVGLTQFYRRDGGAGTCVADGPPEAASLAALEPVPAPPDFVGPLVIG